MGEYFIVARQLMHGSKHGIEGAVLTMNNEKVWSHDFEEITLAIALLGGLLAFLLKLINYFNENIISWSLLAQIFVFSLVGALLLEVLIISLFLVWKGYLVSTRKDSDEFVAVLFKYAFILPILFFISTILWFWFNYIIQDFNINFYRSILAISLIFIIDCILIAELVGKEKLEIASDRASKNIVIEPEILEFLMIILISILITLLYYIIQSFNLNEYLSIGYILMSILIFIIIPFLFVELMGKEEMKNTLNEIVKVKITKSRQTIVIFIIIISVLYLPKLYYELFYVLPSILLMGSFSIEEPLQSADNADILTFIVKETGVDYSKNYISLYKFNAENNSHTEIDNITLPIEPESKNKSMFGGLHDKGVWYLNINSSRLNSGNYMLHAEVTNDVSKNSTFGDFRKRSDKLFYIAPKSTNYSSNSTQH